MRRATGAQPSPEPSGRAIDAANDFGNCQPCTSTQDTNAMAGLGKDCQRKITNFGTRCISGNCRIAAAHQTCVRNLVATQTWLLGVLRCCAN